jgi:hypothetical protein
MHTRVYAVCACMRMSAVPYRSLIPAAQVHTVSISCCSTEFGHRDRYLLITAPFSKRPCSKSMSLLICRTNYLIYVVNWAMARSNLEYYN